MACVRLFGLSIESEVPIHGPPMTSSADVIIKSRRALPGEIFADYDTHVDEDGNIDIQHDGIRFLVTGGDRIEIVTPAGIDRGLVAAWLTGVAFGALLLQRGLLPVHANGVRLPGREGIAAFGGASGTGKSTLAARLGLSGYDLFCDDLLGVRGDVGRPLAVRGLPRLRLWKETIDHLKIDPRSAQQIVDGVEKYELPLDQSGDAIDERPLERFYVLESDPDATVTTITQLLGAQAGRAVLDNSYRWRISAALYGEQWAFERCLEIARSVDVFRVVRPWSLEQEPDAFAAIDDHLRA